MWYVYGRLQYLRICLLKCMHFIQCIDIPSKSSRLVYKWYVYGRLQYLTICLLKCMLLLMCFVWSHLYSKVSLTLVRQWRVIRFFKYYLVENQKLAKANTLGPKYYQARALFTSYAPTTSQFLMSVVCI